MIRVYDDGCLVTKQDPNYPNCAGTPNDYNDRDLAHTAPVSRSIGWQSDRGGITENAWSATKETVKKLGMRLFKLQ